jgi:hypothetical protein
MPLFAHVLPPPQSDGARRADLSLCLVCRLPAIRQETRSRFRTKVALAAVGTQTRFTPRRLRIGLQSGVSQTEGGTISMAWGKFVVVGVTC